MGFFRCSWGKCKLKNILKYASCLHFIVIWDVSNLLPRLSRHGPRWVDHLGYGLCLWFSNEGDSNIPLTFTTSTENKILLCATSQSKKKEGGVSKVAPMFQLRAVIWYGSNYNLWTVNIYIEEYYKVYGKRCKCYQFC